VPLSEDQKAMLRLLAQREEGYEDMAALMGLSVDEVRAKVKEALAEVDDGEAGAQETPTPPEAPVAAPPSAEPPAPQAPPPPTPELPRPARPAFKLKLPKPRPPARRKGGTPGDNRGALVGLGAGAIVVVILIVILIVGGGGGSSSNSTTTAAETGQNETSPTSAENGQLTQAILTPTSGGSGSGRALFGRFKKNVLLQVEAEGLEPSAKGSSYAVWLSHGGKLMVPVGTAKVEASGKLVGRFAVPGAVLVLVARRAFDEIDVTQTSDAALSAAIAKARKENKEPAYTGTDVLRGKITGPLVGAEAKQGE
jgi:outer membrane biosynthesis protein TonB